MKKIDEFHYFSKNIEYRLDTGYSRAVLLCSQGLTLPCRETVVRNCYFAYVHDWQKNS